MSSSDRYSVIRTSDQQKRALLYILVILYIIFFCIPDRHIYDRNTFLKGETYERHGIHHKDLL